MESEEELKPCPFCGKKAKMERSPISRKWFAYCTNKRCGVKPSTFMYVKREAAKVAWNKRSI